jgi:hypothetical protein
MAGDQYDLLKSAQARDAALDQVAENAGDDFSTRAYNAVMRIPKGWVGTGEDIREIVEKEATPHHHNAWGAFISLLCRYKIIEKTGEYRKMRQIKSHARATAVYKKT